MAGDKEHSLRAGALKSSLHVELHSAYAIRLWVGRKRQGERANYFVSSAIFSMRQVIARLGTIYQDARADNPYADAALLKLDKEILSANKWLESAIAELQEALALLPKQVTYTEMVSAKPLSLRVYVHSHSPFGYRCVWLLIGYDQLVLKALHAYHFGLISRQARDRFLDFGGHLIRKIYAIVRPYRSIKVTRQDIINKTPAGQKALTRLGAPDPKILSGKRRSPWSPAPKQKNRRKESGQ